MAISTISKKFYRITLFLLMLFVLLPKLCAVAQVTTSWKGTGSSQTGTDWNEPTNWTNGVPDGTKHAVIGDANLTGAKMPIIDLNAQAACLSLTVGGATAAKLLVSNDKGLLVNGNVLINTNGQLENEGSHMQVTGNWTNNGIYNELLYVKGNINSRSTQYPKVEMMGTSSQMGGSSTNSFNSLIVSGTLTLNAGVNLIEVTKGSNTIQPTLQVNGTLDPGPHLVNIPNIAGVKFQLSETATLYVKGATYWSNYTITPTLWYTASTINYGGANQTIESSIVYGVLRVSGSGVKKLNGNTRIFGAQDTRLFIDAATLDVEAYTLNRDNSPGGAMTIASGATLRIGGTNTLPANYNTYTLHANSTVEYYGTNQTVTNVTYGHLILSTSGTKTMPVTAMAVMGNLTSSGTVSFTAGAAIDVTGNVTIGAGTTYNGGSASHTIGGNWAANGTFVGNASTVTLVGTGKTISSTAGATEFNNLTLTGSGTSITVPALTIRGNLSASGGLTQVANGTVTMVNASAKNISGANINFQNLLIDGIVTATSGFALNGNFTTNAGKSFAASAGTVNMAGASKVIAGTGSMSFWGLNIANATSTTTSFTVNSSLSGASALVATAGTVSFGGTSTFADSHYLYNAAITGTSLKMLAGANLYVANTMAKTTSAAFDVTATPNYVYYNGINPQVVLGTTYHHLILTNTGAKTAGGAITVNGDITLATGSTFNAGSYSHTVQGNWINNGLFNHNNGIVTFAGASNTSVTGATTFSTLGLSKTSMGNTVSLNNNVTAANLQLTTGTIQTGSNKVTLLSNRSGDGWVIGTLTRSHAFTDGTAYAFNGPYAQIAFAAPAGISEVTMTVAPQSISGFTTGVAVNRKYTVAIPFGTYTSGTLQLQYLDTELNGNDENVLKLYRYDTGMAKWRTYGRTSLNSTQNWVNRAALASLDGEWAMSANPSTYTWIGGTSTAWDNAANWQDITDGISIAATAAPLSNDIAILGEVVPTYSPEINAATSISSIQYKGAGKIDLKLISGSLNVANSVSTVGAGSSVLHTLATNGNTLTIGGNLVLNDGSADNSIALVNTTGSIAVAGSITQPAGASIALGSGNLSIGGDYNYTTGASFTPGTSTVTYNGAAAQTVAALPYHNLSINKATATTATLTAAAAQSISGSLTVSGSGSFSLAVPALAVAGGVSVTGGSLTANSSAISVGGNWSTASAALFVPGTSTVTFSGGATQTVSATTFNNLAVTNPSAVTTTGNLLLNGNLNVQNGSLVMDGHTISRGTAGGTLQLADGATIITRGAAGFPANFTTNTLGQSSTVVYDNGTAAVAPVTYGNLTIQGSGTKTLQNNTRVANSMLVSAGATVAGGGANLVLDKDLQNNGTISGGSANLSFTAADAQLYGSGSTAINNLTVNAGAGLTVAANVSLAGNLANNGTALNAAAVQVDFTGSAAATVTSAGASVSIGSLRVSKTGAAVTLGADVAQLQSISIASGTLDAATHNLNKEVSASGTSLVVAAGATLKVGGTNTLPVFDTYSFSPTSTMVYYGGAQTIRAAQYGNLALENTGAKTFATGTTGVAGNLTVAAGTGANLLANSSTLDFNGAGAQSVPGLAYHALLVSGGGEKTLAGNATIASKLELTNGTIVTGANKFTLGNTATIVESESNYVTGLVETQRAVGTDLETFGDIGLTLDADVAPGTVTVIRETGTVVGLNSNSAKRNFRILPSGTNENLNATITLSYFLHEIGSIAENNLSVYATTDDVLWRLQPEQNTVRSSSRKTVALSGVNTLTRVTLGDRMSPLPVDLGYFKAEKLGQDAILTWTTTNEDENKGFEVEVSTDGRAYRKIGFVSKGTGTSRVAILYTFTDKEAGKQGTRYYRLKQLDMDGRTSYFGPRALTFDQDHNLTATAYPNPFKEELFISLPAAAGGIAKISLFDTAGKLLLEQRRNVEAGLNNLALDVANKSLPSGMYIVTVAVGGQVQRIKLMKE